MQIEKRKFNLNFHFSENRAVLLASSSQDTFIRLWKITRVIGPNETDNSESKLLLPDEIDTDQLKIEEKSFELIDDDGVKEKFTFALESVLSGHDSWVSEVKWYYRQNEEYPWLLSSSMDKTMIIWTYSKSNKIWRERVRVGDVGGNSLGFLGGQFCNRGYSILGLGFQGSFHLWRESDNGGWEPGVIVNGHFGPVRDVCWEPKGKFLLSVSADQTTRLHAPWIRGWTEKKASFCSIFAKILCFFSTFSHGMSWLDHKFMGMICKQLPCLADINLPVVAKRKLSEHFRRLEIL